MHGKESDKEGYMKVYNKNKTKELKEYDLEKGYLKDDVLIVHHKEIKGQKEEGHYETIKEYDNGGKDVQWIIDKEYIEARPEWNEEIPIQVYIEHDNKYLIKEKIKKQIEDLKEILKDTDYKTLKYIDGEYTDEEYEPIKEYRCNLRNQIRLLKEELYNEEIKKNI